MMFCCPGCGASTRAPRADAGNVIACDRCGTEFRAPRSPHPLESDSDDIPLVSPPAAQSAAAGLRLLTVSLGIWAAGFASAVGFVVAWVTVDGPGAVLGREGGRVGWLAPAAAALWLTLAGVGAALRWVGYGRCGRAADAVRAGGWLMAARSGVVVGLAGLTAGLAPEFAGRTVNETPLTLRAVALLGDLARVAGALMELATLLVWSRLLTEARGRSAARVVARYAAGLILALACSAFGVCGVGLVTAAALGRTGPPPPTADRTARFDWAAVPDDGWAAAAALAGGVAAFAFALAWLYRRVLRATAAAMTDLAAR